MWWSSISTAPPSSLQQNMGTWCPQSNVPFSTRAQECVRSCVSNHILDGMILFQNPKGLSLRIFNKLYISTIDTSKTRRSAGYYCTLDCTKALPSSGLSSILYHLEIWQLSVSLGLWGSRIPRYITKVPNQGWLCSPGDIWPSLEPVFHDRSRGSAIQINLGRG